MNMYILFDDYSKLKIKPKKQMFYSFFKIKKTLIIFKSLNNNKKERFKKKTAYNAILRAFFFHFNREMIVDLKKY